MEVLGEAEKWREGQQAADEAGAALGDGAELGGVVLVLGAEDAGDIEEIAVEAECGEEIAGVVGEAGGVSEGGGRVRRGAG